MNAPVSEGSRTGVLLTGATGFLGKLLLLELLARDDVGPLYLLIRARGPRSGKRRFERDVARAACFRDLPEGWTRRVRVVEGDLVEPGCGLSEADREELVGTVQRVIHAAASVEFDLPLTEATEANATSAVNLLALARELPALEHLTFVSTAYVTPHPGDGVPVHERAAPLPAPPEAVYAAAREGTPQGRAWLAEAGHPNTYTFTKCLAEGLLAERGADLPISIVRPSIISASWRDPFPGWIDSAAAFAGFVMLIGAGHLRAVVGDLDARLDIVPVDWVAQRTVDVGLGPVPEGAAETHPVHLVTAGLAGSPSIQDCREGIVGFFRANPAGRRTTVSYVGPAGARFGAMDALHNQLPVRWAMLRSPDRRPRARRLLARLEEINAIFPYFTQRSFDFRASVPLEREPADAAAERRPWDPVGYIATVCGGVRRHLLRVSDGGPGGTPAGPSPETAARPAESSPPGSVGAAR